MEIKRNIYLNKLISKKHNGLIKVVTGIRRCGKSYLLFNLFKDHLLAEGVNPRHIIEIAFDSFENKKFRDPDVLYPYMKEQIQDEDMYYVLLDEVQLLDEFEAVLNSLIRMKNVDIYVTGSNAKMLSQDVATTLGGRYITVHVYPYDFKEFLYANGVEVTENSLFATESRAEIKRIFNDYFRSGGFPEGASLAAKRDYLTSVYQKIYLGDIAARHSIENTFALRILFRKLAESIKQPVSFTRITNIVASTGVKISKNTVINYMEYAKDACLLIPIQNIADKLVERETNPKYYFADNGILNLLLLDADTSLLENLVAVTLLRRYGTDDAVFFYNRNVEVDFYLPDTGVAIQVCYTMNLSDETFQREVQALVKLNKVFECRQLLIITYDDEERIELEKCAIEVIPVWKWLLGK